MKSKGSEIFGTTQIATDEYLLLARVFVENGSSNEEAVLCIEALDNMLSCIKIWPIIQSNRYTRTGRIRPNSALSDMLSRRLDVLLDDLSAVRR
jgi:hypothetical protein